MYRNIYRGNMATIAKVASYAKDMGVDVDLDYLSGLSQPSLDESMGFLKSLKELPDYCNGLVSSVEHAINNCLKEIGIEFSSNRTGFVKDVQDAFKEHIIQDGFITFRDRILYAVTANVPWIEKIDAISSAFVELYRGIQKCVEGIAKKHPIYALAFEASIQPLWNMVSAPARMVTDVSTQALRIGAALFSSVSKFNSDIATRVKMLQKYIEAKSPRAVISSQDKGQIEKEVREKFALSGEQLKMLHLTVPQMNALLTFDGKEKMVTKDLLKSISKLLPDSVVGVERICKEVDRKLKSDFDEVIKDATESFKRDAKISFDKNIKTAFNAMRNELRHSAGRNKSIIERLAHMVKAFSHLKEGVRGFDTEMTAKHPKYTSAIKAPFAITYAFLEKTYLAPAKLAFDVIKAAGRYINRVVSRGEHTRKLSEEVLEKGLGVGIKLAAEAVLKR